jgi:hypothetical protein
MAGQDKDSNALPPKPRRGQEKRLVAILEEGLEKKYPELYQRIKEEMNQSN